jgi:hypothetical protein
MSSVYASIENKSTRIGLLSFGELRRLRTDRTAVSLMSHQLITAVRVSVRVTMTEVTTTIDMHKRPPRKLQFYIHTYDADGAAWETSAREQSAMPRSYMQATSLPATRSSVTCVAIESERFVIWIDHVDRQERGSFAKRKILGKTPQLSPTYRIQ